MYQSSVQPVFPPKKIAVTRVFNSNLHMTALINEKKVIRIVNPQLQNEIEARFANGRKQANIIHYRGQMYLSLQKILDSKKREKVFSLLRCYQIDPTINIDSLPHFLQIILGKSASERNTFVASLTISTFLGGLSGILALALCVIGLMVGGVSTYSESGMKITAASFAIGSILGCVICTAVLWLRFQQKANSYLN